MLYAYQRRALEKMRDGCILYAKTGLGKSRTAVAYYYTAQRGSLSPFKPMSDPQDLYIITTAKKRDTGEWEDELIPFAIRNKQYKNKVIIDSWNNIKKYSLVSGAFFIFDEDKVTGRGAWVKTFLKIAKNNRWIILSATPGDVWDDYIPVFIANGFYKNFTDFDRKHVVLKHHVNYRAVDRYLDTGRLNALRRRVLVPMTSEGAATQHHFDVWCDYDKVGYKDLIRLRFNPWTDEPICNSSEFCYCLRRKVNESDDRQIKLLEILEDHRRVIIFYNFDYELLILRTICSSAFSEVREWNGHKHEEIPDGVSWAYLVQYTAGAEGWNCISTDTVIFYSQNYSYKTTTQAAGRIDRANTTYTDLYYYHLKSKSGIDLAISAALKKKKNFNEREFSL